MGILLYEMIDPPLTVLKSADIHRNKFGALTKLPYSEEIKLFIQKLCNANPLSRPTVDEILSDNICKDFIVSRYNTS